MPWVSGDQPHGDDGGHEHHDHPQNDTPRCVPPSAVGPSIASRHGDPNQVVSASLNPVSVPSPTQATYPSGLISTAAGAATRPRAGSSQSPLFMAASRRAR